MEHLLGLIRIRIQRGINLVKRDCMNSDPYVVVCMGKQKLKTRVVKKNINPKWEDDLTLGVADASLPIKLYVYDKDTFSFDDKMGDAEFDIGPLLKVVRMRLGNLPNGTILATVKPTKENRLSQESHIIWSNGRVVQNMILKLRNVTQGEIEQQIQWIDIPGCRGL